MTTASSAVIGAVGASSPRRGRDAVRAALLGIRWGIGVLVAALVGAVLVLPVATGAKPLTVLTGSMRPDLPPGTLVVVRPIDPDTIRTGDVITFQVEPGRPGVVTHRVVGVRSLSDGTLAFVTRGDANPGPDPAPVLPAQVEGRLWYSVPLIGSVGLVLGAHRTLLLPLAGAGLLGYAAVVVVTALIRARRRGAVRALEHRRRHVATDPPSADGGRRTSGVRRSRP